jgi:hypothetical protein
MCLSALNIKTHDGNYIDLFILKNINCCVTKSVWLYLFIVLNATFSNISAISWRPVLVVEEAGVPGENHRPWASNRILHVGPHQTDFEGPGGSMG